MPYVIQNTHTFQNKKGEDVSVVSYFKRHNSDVFHFNSMVCGPAEARQYEFKTEANREKRKYFPGRKNVKVVKL